MRTFTITFPDDGLGEPKVIHFQGRDPFSAFSILDTEAGGREIQLSEGQTHLASISLHPDGYWMLR